MKYIIIILYLITSHSYSQDTIFLNKKYEITENKFDQVYFKTLAYDDNSDSTTEQIFLKDGKLKAEKTYDNYNSKKKNLIERKRYYPNEQLHIHSFFKKNKLHGNLYSYWENGQMKRKDIFKNGKVKEGECWDKNGNLVDYHVFESNPEFPGGSRAMVSYLNKNFNTEKIPTNIKGNRIIVKFEIDVDGKVGNITMTEPVNPIVKQEIMGLISGMPDWEPATQDGKKVKVTRSIPLVF